MDHGKTIIGCKCLAHICTHIYIYIYIYIYIERDLRYLDTPAPGGDLLILSLEIP